MGLPRYWRNIPQYYNLAGSKCKDCNSIYFPPRYLCDCSSESFDNYELSWKGKIISYTVLRNTLSDPSTENVDVITSEVPVILAIIETENKVRLTAEIVDCGPEDVEIGSNVEAVFRKIMEKGEKGIIQYGYKFRLTE